MRFHEAFTIGVTAAIATAASASCVCAQQLLAEFANPDRIPGGDGFGNNVAWLGDIDGDGTNDALISAPWENAPPTHAVEGVVYVISGATGATIRQHLGPQPLARLGLGGFAAGADIDGDGFFDYAMEASDTPNPTHEGTVYVYSGASGNLLYTLVGENPEDGLCCPRFIGDVDGDGIQDLGLIAAGFDASPSKTLAGRAYVYSGVSMTLLYTVTGTKSNLFMTPVSGIGDVDFDGHADFVVGWDGWNAGPNGEGKLEAYSGATGAMIYRRVGEGMGDGFGHSENWIGDVDADGNPDFIVRAPYHDIVEDEGRIYVYSGPSGRLLYELDGRYKDEMFGMVPLVGNIDLNGDGFDDILIGTEYVPTGGGTGTGPSDSSVLAYSGRSGRLLYELRGKQFGPGLSSESLGSSLSAFGDFNQDGFDDVIVGASNWSDAMWSGAGRAYIYGGNDLFLQANQESFLAGDPITLANRGGTPGLLSMIVLTDVSGASMFVPVLMGALDGNGELTISSTTPPGLSGISCTFMGYAVKASGHGLADSISETITFQ